MGHMLARGCHAWFNLHTFALGALLALSMVHDAVASTGSPTVNNSGTSEAMRDVLLVGNNWDGTAEVIDVREFRPLMKINVIPDRAERMAEINSNPIRWTVFQFIRGQVGEGNDQFVDDLYASTDGREIYVSRPSFGDVVAIQLATGQIRWRTRVDGHRADHMAISPDGTSLVVSASTAKVAHIINTLSGQITATFPTGDQPHENTYSRDGSTIFNASIGSIFTPLDEPWLDWTKGDRYLQIIDARTLEVRRKIKMGEKLAAFGMKGMSSSVRPMTLSPDERFLYLQVSFFHGFIEYDVELDQVTRVATLPIAEETSKLRRDQYILDSAHHGIAMSGDGTKLCVAGTMSNYAAIVSRETFQARIHPLGARTYWATTSADGRYCYVSVAGDDSVSVISYESEQEVARIPVGNHPQRARTGRLAEDIFR